MYYSPIDVLNIKIANNLFDNIWQKRYTIVSNEGWEEFMILIAIVDDRNGMMFNKRRQSQDRILIKKVLSITHGQKLWMNLYSYKMFKNYDLEHQIYVDDDFLNKAKENDYCFVENQFICQYIDKISEIILFKWNRKYPGDFFFDIKLDSEWSMTCSEDFVGNSHEKITMEVYVHE